MPNRNSADEREKYDHSAHSTKHRQKGDLPAPAGENPGGLSGGISEQRKTPPVAPAR